MDADTAQETAWPPQRMPGNSAPAGCFITTLLAAILPLLAFAMLLSELSLTTSMSGHLIWPFFQWAFVTVNGALIVSLIGGIALAPFFFWFVRQTIARMLAVASDVTDEQEFELPRHPQFQMPQFQVSTDTSLSWRWLLLYALTGGGTSLLMSLFEWLFITNIVDPALPSCARDFCVPNFYAAPSILFLAPAVGLWLALAAGFAWLLWIQHRCHIWLRKEPLVWRGLDYIRHPGVTADAAMAALARYRAVHIPQPRDYRVWSLIPISLAIVWVNLGQLLDAWLQLLWRP